ncbi:hypothetical protein V1520DRAFT_327847 [Lipomyces starkeyi]|uniref:Major facilitator superfamily (MFS) profile domain-containing protein n=1 Tax=Lipomyces starkeyi NRRL Y-11557 TaxID=675824 RepID=A0A1E3Q2I0_LIPST|nr:hypothetical protein LIPSTDRAFT_29024 [Lipomyces starkeyi NRRL Y-11557]
MVAAVDTERAVTEQVDPDVSHDLLAEAKDATDQEHQMSIKLYPKAVRWSFVLSLAVIMEGYDLILLGSFYAFPTFVRKYGELQPNGRYRFLRHGKLASAMALEPVRFSVYNFRAIWISEDHAWCAIRPHWFVFILFFLKP